LRTVELIELFTEKDHSMKRQSNVNKALQKLRSQKRGANPAAKTTYGRPPANVVDRLDPDAVAGEGIKATVAAAAFDAVAEEVFQLPFRHTAVQDMQGILSDLQLLHPAPLTRRAWPSAPCTRSCSPCPRFGT
jgi:hypothetical protein